MEEKRVREREVNTKRETDTENEKGSEAKQELLMRSTVSRENGSTKSAAQHLTKDAVIIDLSHQMTHLCMVSVF